MAFILSILGIFIIWLLVTKLGPRLDASLPATRVPDSGDHMSLVDLSNWLDQTEAEQHNLIANTASHVAWANENNPAITEYCFLYIHGFSASWKETAPVTQQLANHFNSNVVQGRLAGHGLADDGMTASAEDWLQSVRDQYEIARRLGKKVIIVATSTGAPLSVWLCSHFGKEIAACCFLSPNFRIRSPLGFLLTWPLSRYWMHLIVGRRRRWEPQSTDEAQTWSHDYSTLALIEMQKTVDWTADQALENINTPLAIMYMRNDTTIFPPAAIDAFKHWGGSPKELIEVSLDGDAEEHVFVGDITGPTRVAWCVSQLTTFLQTVIEANQSTVSLPSKKEGVQNGD
ncbi:MAG: alpha/beta hydrolase [Pseudomonadales bacterium]|nr:alpha/beta hydrolase [Pseudomonadales bacterium]MDG1443141.1 alpha/beta hydrolase [Pseudomonadales bacterium]